MTKAKPNPPKQGGNQEYTWCQSFFGRKRGHTEPLDAARDPRIADWVKAGLLVKAGDPMPEGRSRSKAEVLEAIKAAQKDAATKEIESAEESRATQRPRSGAEAPNDEGG